MSKEKVKKGKEQKDFDKYYYYHKSVQSPDVDVKFFDRVYKEMRGKEALSLKEDFCGTFSISCEWVKSVSYTHLTLPTTPYV